jgi:hypothetical protein
MQEDSFSDYYYCLSNVIITDVIDRLYDLNGKIDKYVIDKVNRLHEEVDKETIKNDIIDNSCVSPFLLFTRILYNITIEVLNFLLENFSYLLDVCVQDEHISFKEYQTPLYHLVKSPAVKLEHVKLFVEHDSKLKYKRSENIVLCFCDNPLFQDKMDILEYLISLGDKNCVSELLFHLCASYWFKFNNLEQIKKIESFSKSKYINYYSSYYKCDILTHMFNNNKYYNEEIVNHFLKNGCVVTGVVEGPILDEYGVFEFLKLLDNCDYVKLAERVKSFFTEKMIDYIIEKVKEITYLDNKEEIIYELSTLETKSKSAAKI